MKVTQLTDEQKRQIEVTNKKFADAHKQMMESIVPLLPPLSIFEQLNEYARSVQVMFDSLQKSMQPIIEAHNMALEMIKKFVATIDFEQLNKIAQQLADEGLKLEVLEMTGWWYCPSMENIEPEKIKIAATNYKSGKRKAITNLFLEVYKKNEYELLNKTVNSWESNLFFKKRMKPINDALGAHMEGKFTLSIPTLLPIAEGIATDYCKSKGIYNSDMRSKGSKKIKSAFEEVEKKGLHPFHFPDLFITLIEKMIYQDTSKIKDPFHKKLNRHGILHGTYTNYHDSVRSLKCFLLLDALSALD